MIRTVALAEVPPQPWRNRGGLTHELLAWPASPAWALRVSVARIERSGPFSAYPGVERWLTVLDGAGMVLRFAARRALLAQGSEPLRFDGAAAPECDLLDGATLDLNLMLRVDAGRGSMTAVRGDGTWASPCALRALFTWHSATLHIDAADAVDLPAATLAWSGQAAHQRWRVDRGSQPLRAWWLHWSPRTP